MRGRLDNGLKYAQQGDVRVVLYAGCKGGTVQIKRGDSWGIAQAGDVTHGTVIELTLEANSVPRNAKSGWTDQKGDA